MWDVNDIFNVSLLILGAINLLVAFFLLLLPDLFKMLNEILSKSIHTEKIEEALNKHHDIDGSFLKVRKVIGLTSVVLGVIFMYLYFKG